MARIKISLCPSCGYKIDSDDVLVGDDSVSPQKGDVSLCINCGALLAFIDGEGSIKLLTETELATLNTENKQILFTVRQMIKDRGRIR